MRLPFALDPINVWLLNDVYDTPEGHSPGWTIIDCGVANDATRDAWSRIFSSCLNGFPVVRIMAPHCHSDHVGLADWLGTQWQAPWWMSGVEYGFARMMSAALPGADGTSAVPRFMRHGVRDPALIAQLQERINYYPSLVLAVPPSYHRMQDGHTIRIGQNEWRVITGFGRSPEHASLYCAAL